MSKSSSAKFFFWFWIDTIVAKRLIILAFTFLFASLFTNERKSFHLSLSLYTPLNTWWKRFTFGSSIGFRTLISDANFSIASLYSTLLSKLSLLIKSNLSMPVSSKVPSSIFSIYRFKRDFCVISKILNTFSTFSTFSPFFALSLLFLIFSLSFSYYCPRKIFTIINTIFVPEKHYIEIFLLKYSVLYYPPSIKLRN